MALFSRRFSLWRALEDRLLLEATPASETTPMVSEVVVPVLSADLLLQTPTVNTANADLSVAAGTPIKIYTVPDGEEWRLVQYRRESTAANSVMFIEVGSAHRMGLDAGSTSEANLDMRGFIMRPGDSLGMEATGNAGDNIISSHIAYDLVQLR
jgi:hypothetical protein